MPSEKCIVKRFVVFFQRHYIFPEMRPKGHEKPLGSALQGRASTRTRRVMSSWPWVL